MNTPVWISLGSNLGDRASILESALDLLRQTSGVAVAQVSSFRETAPVGGPPGQGPFLNAAARLETSMSPRELLGETRRIEDQLGRVRTVRWGERTLDLDLLIFGSKFVDEPDLKLPHPRLAVRRFVLEPLAEIAPAIVDTVTRRTMRDLVENLQVVPRLVMLAHADPAAGSELMARIAAGLGGLTSRRAEIPTLAERPILDYARMGRDRREVLAQMDHIRATIRRFDQEDFGWVIADFWLDILSLKWLAVQHLDPALGSSLDSFRPDRQWKNLLRGHLRDVPNPTFVLALPGSDLRWRPNLSSTPIYWPEATDLDGIVAEVVAVCRGIESA